MTKQGYINNNNKLDEYEGMYDDISLISSGEVGDVLDENGNANSERLREVEELVNGALLKDVNCDEMDNI